MRSTQPNLFDLDESPDHLESVSATRPIPPSQIELRYYQQDCIDASLNALKRGVKRQLICLPTASGKSCIMANLFPQVPAPFPQARQVLLLAHRDELISQLAHHAKSNNPELIVEIEKAEQKASPNADVIVASVQTLGRKDSKRIEKFNPRDFKVVCCDESHRAVAQGYKNIFDYFGVLDRSSHVVSIGFTATPQRSDKVGLSSVYDEIVYYRSPVDLIEEGFLSKIRVRSIRTETDISGVSTNSDGDFSITELSGAVNNPQRNEAIVDAYLEYCKDRKSTLVFGVDVAHVKALTDCFIARGIDARLILGETDSDERRVVLDDFKNQKYPVLINCLVVSEGADVPCITAIMMCRPTGSTLLAIQMMGRGLRLHKDKQDCLILDVCDIFKKKSVVTIPSLFGLDPEFDVDGEDVVKVYRQMEELVSQDINAHRAKSLSQALKIVSSEEFNPFDFQDDPSLRQFSDNAWKRMGEAEHFALELLGKGFLEIAHNMLDHYECIFRSEDGKVASLGEHDSLASAFRKADGWINGNLDAPTRSLISLKTEWNFKPPSLNQISLLAQFYIPIPLKGGGTYIKDKYGRVPLPKEEQCAITRRQATNMISKAINKKKKAKEKKELKRRGGGRLVSKMDDTKVGRLV